MAAVQRTFFEEKKMVNPAFAKTLNYDYCCRQVTRFIKDIKYMKKEDFIYFRADNILSACTYVSNIKYKESYLILNSLLNYQFNVLNTSMTFESLEYKTICGELIHEMQGKLQLWMQCRDAFNYLSSNKDANPYDALYHISAFSDAIFKSL